MQRNSKKKYKLGDLLKEYGLINEEQLQIALNKQRETGYKLGDVLINLGFVTQQSICDALEFQLGMPYVNIKDYQLDQDAIKLLNESMVRKHQLIPVRLKGNDLYVAMVDPLNILSIDDITLFTGKNVIPLLASDEQIYEAIDIYYGKQEALAAIEQYKKENLSDDEVIEKIDEEEDLKSAPIVKLVNTILEQSVRYRSSDIHIEPFEKRVRVRFRIDGRLKEIMDYEITLLPAIVARIKIIAGMDIAEKRKPQDGRISFKVDRKEYDVRVSCLPTVYGEKIVMRITSKEGLTKSKEELGLFEDDHYKFDQILNNPHGIILVTGPTGSGKSTTLYTALNELNREDINIVTVEDPVEANIEGINQVQVNVKTGLTFASALRSILRQDPDIIMIGEIRDKETAEIAVKASITGHLVVSTLHTNSAPSSITRLIDMGIEPFMIGASVVGVIAQRLVRKLCPKCRQQYELEEHEKKLLEIDDNSNIKVYKPVGCHYCNNTGYQGRIGVYEIMTVTGQLRKLINKGANSNEIKEQAIRDNMNTLKENAIKLVLDGTTSLDEMLRIAYEVE